MSKPTEYTDTATEKDEQIALIEWAGWQTGKYPELELLYHIPNGGFRYKSEAGRLKRMGVNPGMPDLCLPVARCGYNALYIELKRNSESKPTKLQLKKITELNRYGNYAVVCAGQDEARAVIMRYLNGRV